MLTNQHITRLNQAVNSKAGAEEGTRTPTPLRVHGPEPCASANSATSARVRANSRMREPAFSPAGSWTAAVASLAKGPGKVKPRRVSGRAIREDSMPVDCTHMAAQQKKRDLRNDGDERRNADTTASG